MVQPDRITSSRSLPVGWLLLTLVTGVSGCGDAGNESVSQVDQSVETQHPDTESSPVHSPGSPATESTAEISSTSARTAAPVLKNVPAESPAPSDPGATDPSAKVTSATKLSRPAGESKARIESQLAALEIPPAWLAEVQSTWNVAAKPWKEGRMEIRRLLGVGDEASRREGIRLTWDYLQKEDIGNGHEYGMYLFLGKEPLWAIRVYREWVARSDHEYPPFFELKALASLYCDYGLFEDAEALLEQGLATPPPKAEWKEVRQAEFHDAFGDLYSRWGQLEKARTSYQQAIRLYPLGKPPYGRHLLPRKARKVSGKLRLLTLNSLSETQLKDGTYLESAVGYSGDIHLTVRTLGGRIVDIQAKHQEKIDQNASTIIPQRIIARQNLQVDGITGATITKDALIAGTLRALKQAGLK